jgi:hypothetical protein
VTKIVANNPLERLQEAYEFVTDSTNHILHIPVEWLDQFIWKGQYAELQVDITPNITDPWLKQQMVYINQQFTNNMQDIDAKFSITKVILSTKISLTT